MKSWIPAWPSRTDTLDTDSPPHHANDSGTSFQNPWPPKSLLASRQVFSQFPLALAKRIEGYDIKTVQTVQPDFGQGTADEGAVKATWLGHAVCLIPVLGEMCA